MRAEKVWNFNKRQFRGSTQQKLRQVCGDCTNALCTSRIDLEKLTQSDLASISLPALMHSRYGRPQLLITVCRHVHLRQLLNLLPIWGVGTVIVLF